MEAAGRMTRRPENRGSEPEAAGEVLKKMVSRMAAHAPAVGENATAIAGVSLYRRTEPSACYCATVEPGFSIFLQGRKRINLGGTEYFCGGGSFLLSSIDVPVQSQVIEASERMPMLSVFLRLDMAAVRDVIVREDLPEPDGRGQRRGLAVGVASAGMLSACMRLVELLDTPEDIPFLSPLIQREIIYRILRTPQGERLRAIATSGDLSNRTARAIAWLRANFAKPLRVEELAGMARMGVSTLHHQFRTLTAMSPLQYQKQLRLQTARQRMLMDGMDATSAAYEVGYESVSQFSREYSRLFGMPPMRDVKAMRGSKVVAINAA